MFHKNRPFLDQLNNHQLLKVLYTDNLISLCSIVTSWWYIQKQMNQFVALFSSAIPQEYYNNLNKP